MFTTLDGRERVGVLSTEWGDSIQTLAQLRAVVDGDRTDHQVRLVEDETAVFRFDEQGLGADDGESVILPDDLTVLDQGRWFRVAPGSAHALTHEAGGPDEIASLPTADQKSALAGTAGTPGAGNRFLTDGDPRNSNARTPTTHAESHKGDGSDAIAVATVAIAGLLSATDKTKLDKIRIVASGSDSVAALTSSTVGTFVREVSERLMPFLFCTDNVENVQFSEAGSSVIDAVSIRLVRTANANEFSVIVQNHNLVLGPTRTVEWLILGVKP